MIALPLAWLVLVGVGSPLVLFGILGAASILNRPLTERWTGILAGGSMSVACAALTSALLVSGAGRAGPLLMSFGSGSASRAGGIAIEFLVDPAALGFGALCIAVQVFFSYERTVRLLKWLTLSLFAYVAVVLSVSVPWHTAAIESLRIVNNLSTNR